VVRGAGVVPAVRSALHPEEAEPETTREVVRAAPERSMLVRRCTAGMVPKRTTRLLCLGRRSCSLRELKAIRARRPSTKSFAENSWGRTSQRPSSGCWMVARAGRDGRVSFHESARNFHSMQIVADQLIGRTCRFRTWKPSAAMRSRRVSPRSSAKADFAWRSTRVEPHQACRVCER